MMNILKKDVKTRIGKMANKFQVTNTANNTTLPTGVNKSAYGQGK